MLVVIVLLIIFAIVIFFAIGTKTEQRNKIQQKEENCIFQRLKDINDRIDELNRLELEIYKSYNMSSIPKEEHEKIDCYKKEVQELEKERYDLTGQPTSTQLKIGIGNDMRDLWKRKHGIPTQKEISKQQEEQAAKKNTHKIPWFAVGMAIGALNNAQTEQKKRERELRRRELEQERREIERERRKKERERREIEARWKRY